MGILEEDENSMLNWYPKLKEIDGVRTPKTVIIECEKFPEPNKLIGYDKEKVEEAVEEVGGYPVFIRTDHASDKHHLEDVSKVYGKEELHRKIWDLAQYNLRLGIFGVEYKAIAVREWLDIKYRFKAFAGDLPIAYEIRAFIRDGEVECKHFYWYKGAIKETREKPDDWEEKLKETREETMERWDEVRAMAEAVAEEFNGWWSVDFALSEDDMWYLIDMGRGKDSFHPPECEHAPEEIKERYGNNKSDDKSDWFKEVEKYREEE